MSLIFTTNTNIFTSFLYFNQCEGVAVTLCNEQETFLILEYPFSVLCSFLTSGFLIQSIRIPSCETTEFFHDLTKMYLYITDYPSPLLLPF